MHSPFVLCKIGEDAVRHPLVFLFFCILTIVVFVRQHGTKAHEETSCDSVKV